MTDKVIDNGCNDIGNKERFVRQHGDKVRYIDEEKRWVAYDGARWSSKKVKIKDLAERTAKSIHNEAKQSNSRELSNHAHRSRNWGPIKSMLNLASEALSVSVNEFDTDPELINCKNGVVNLRTGKLDPHDNEQMFLKQADANYNPAVGCPLWVKFLEDVFEGNGDLIEYVQQALGYTLTSYVNEHCFFLLYGGGRNGKRLFSETPLAIMGDYARPSDFETFLATDKSNVRVKEEVGRLKGLRLALASETDSSRRFSEALVKRLTGGDMLIGTKLGGSSYDFKPTHKLWFQANHLPAIKDASVGMWERVRIIPFNKTYLGDDQDKFLDKKLLAEADGILVWMVEGAMKYLAAEKLPKVPEVCLEATKAYRDENDLLSKFVSERLEQSLGDKIGVGPTHKELERWCQENGHEVPCQLKWLRSNMRERGIVAKEVHKQWYFMNYTLKTTQPANDNPDSWDNTKWDNKGSGLSVFRPKGISSGDEVLARLWNTKP
jgi:putative DNA primase/helicase